MTQPLPITLDSLRQNPKLPPRIGIYGPAGIGKTSFCAGAPKPVFILTEDGLGDLDVTSFPVAKTLSDVEAAMNILLNEEHDFQTLVLDSLDWLEPLFWDRVAKQQKVENIEDIGYGKGFNMYVPVEIRKILALVDRLRAERGMIFIYTAHQMMRKVTKPDTASHDTIDLKLHHRAADIFKEYSDVILYATFKTTLVKEDEGFGKKRNRVIGNGERELRTVGCDAYTAKSRYTIPPVLPLSWDAFFEAMTKKAK